MIKKVVIIETFFEFSVKQVSEEGQNRKKRGLSHSITTILIEILRATSEWLEQQKWLLQSPCLATAGLF